MKSFWANLPSHALEGRTGIHACFWCPSQSLCSQLWWCSEWYCHCYEVSVIHLLLLFHSSNAFCRKDFKDKFKSYHVRGQGLDASLGLQNIEPFIWQKRLSPTSRPFMCYETSAIVSIIAPVVGLNKFSDEHLGYQVNDSSSHWWYVFFFC